MVLAPAARTAYTQTIQSLSELFLFAMETHFAVQSMRMVVPTRQVHAALGIGAEASGAKWLLVKGLRSVTPGGRPICWTHSYINPRLAWIGPELRHCVGPFYAHLEQRSGEPITEVSQEISAELMTKEIADALGHQPADPSLRVLRRYLGEHEMMIASFNWHPADSFRYRMHLKRADTARAR